MPKPLRDLVWRVYVPGQEITKNPSRNYVYVAQWVQAWIRGEAKMQTDGVEVTCKLCGLETVITFRSLPFERFRGMCAGCMLDETTPVRDRRARLTQLVCQLKDPAIQGAVKTSLAKRAKRMLRLAKMDGVK